MFEEQKTDNNITIKQNIQDRKESTIKSKNIQILDFQNGSSYTEQLDLNSQDVSRILNVGHFGTGAEVVNTEFCTNLIENNNPIDEPTAQKSRFGNNNSVLDMPVTPAVGSKFDVISPLAQEQ